MLSIIIPYYNNSRQQIFRCLKSILANEYENCEILIVNDGSTEESRAVLSEAALLDPRIQVISQENAGPSAARNRGVKEAQGEYVMFADADDALLPGVLCQGMQIVEEKRLDLLIGQVMVCTDNQTVMPPSEPLKQGETVTAGEETVYYEGNGIDTLKSRFLYSSIEQGKAYFGKGPVARVIRRELAVDTPFHTDLVIGEDMVWNQELLGQCRNVGVEQKLWYLYYYNEQSVMHRFTPDVVSQYERQFRYIRRVVDLSDDSIFYHYCMHVSDALVHVYLLLLCRKEWNVSREEKKALIRRLYEEKPWSVLASRRFYDLADRHEQIKCFLYRRKLFFVALCLQKRKGGRNR